MRFALVLTLGLAACFAPGAQLLEPRKASDLVTLLSGAPTTSGCVGGSERPIDIQITPDGPSAPFAIPAGKVLVLRGIEWNSTGTGAGTSVVLTVFYRTPAGVQSVFTSHAQSTSVGAGFAGRQDSIPDVVVKPGVPLCVTQHIDNQPAGGTLPGYALLHGFLAEDE